MPITPTVEQAFAVERFQTGQNLKISAFAGTGKTTTLGQIAAATNRRGLYLAFNKSIAVAAQGCFPHQRVECKTTHALAINAIRTSEPRFTTERLTSSLYANTLAASLALTSKHWDSGLVLSPVQQAHIILKTVTNYCQSAEQDISLQHVPLTGRLCRLSSPAQDEIREWALKASSKLWNQMIDPAGSMPLGHDGYLKLWSLSEPSISAAYILLDEAQDTNPAVLSVLSNQDAQVVYVGDSHQQIYEWRGAVDAMHNAQVNEHAYLTQSFRFGERLANAATNVLRSIGETRLLTGNHERETEIVATGPADVVLARTNATTIIEALNAISSGVTTFVIGGTKEMKDLVSDVYDLQKGRPGNCPEFFGFTNWQEVVAFARSEEGANLLTFVQLVEQHGADKLWLILSQVETNEENAQLVISTAHKAKGREWDRVRLANDFSSKRLSADAPAPEAEVRLFYVAMTRAKKCLVVDSDILREFETASWRFKRSSSSESTRAPSQRAEVIIDAGPRESVGPVSRDNQDAVQRMRDRLNRRTE